MSTRYEQYCPVARALEVVGERWTLLVVRELLLGPRRFTDLLSGLPGVSTNVLTGRLKELEQAGLVAKRALPAPAGSVVYELTDEAAGLAVVVAAMADWGKRLLGRPRPDDEVHGSWLVLGLAVTAKIAPTAADATYELRIDGDAPDAQVFHIESHDGHLQPRQGPATSPASVITVGTTTLAALASGDLDPRSTKAKRLIQVDGDVAGGRRLLDALAASTP
jgi:DNA-binding HxlR family transcriptional regulator